MLRLAGQPDADVEAALKDGRAMDKWRVMISAQGGDPDAKLPAAKESHTIVAPSSGVLTDLDALAVGIASWRLGAGRERKEDPIQFGAGVILHAQRGDRVEAGAPLMTLLTDEPSRFARAIESAETGFKIDASASPESAARSIVLDRING
jgi:thymidine phosphorylase